MARAIEIHMHVRERGRNEGPCGECTRCEPIRGRQTKNQREEVYRERGRAKEDGGGRGAYAGGGTREAMGGGGGSSPVSMPMPRLSME